MVFCKDCKFFLPNKDEDCARFAIWRQSPIDGEWFWHGPKVSAWNQRHSKWAFFNDEPCGASGRYFQPKSGATFTK